MREHSPDSGPGFTERPADWPHATHHFERAHQLTMSALTGALSRDRFTRYYRRDGNHAGVTFLDVGPFDNYAITSGDIVALMTINVSLPAYAIRQLLGPTRTMEAINRCLAEDKLPIDADVRFAGVSTLRAMERLYLHIKAALSQSGIHQKDTWVAASKLCARKRPDLFPAPDRIVCQYLGLLRDGNYQADWQVFRYLISQRDVRDAIDLLVDHAIRQPQVEAGSPARYLRHLDVALRMHTGGMLTPD